MIFTSAASREKYNAYHEIIVITAKMMEKHYSTRWLKFEKVLVKLMEQWENLSSIFLAKFHPGFTGSKGSSSTARYACIKGYLQSKKIPVVIAFVVSFAEDFREFMETFNTNAPLIHLIPKMPAVVAHCIRQIPEG